MTKKTSTCFLTVATLGARLTALLLSPLAQAAAPPIEWTRQLGTAQYEYSFGAGADSVGNVYISASTEGSLANPSAGMTDGVVAKFDAAGNSQWIKQFGTTSSDYTQHIALDGFGNIHTAGGTSGNLDGPNAGDLDAYYTKFDATGNMLSTKQWGTNRQDEALGISVDSAGNVYASGVTYGNLNGLNLGGEDIYVRKYNAAGVVQWTSQYGTSGDDRSQGVSVDGLGNIFVSGNTFGDLAGPNFGAIDIFVSKYDPLGNRLWTKQFGSVSADGMVDVEADGLGNVYIAGSTLGNMQGPNAGATDAFIAKYDASGNESWIRQFGTAGHDTAYALAVDASGTAYVSGSTEGALAGPNAGSSDIFVGKMDSLGNWIWITQMGTSESDRAYAIATNSSEEVYVSGVTFGSLNGQTNYGAGDVFLLKFSAVPEPAATAMLVAVGLTCRIRRRKSRPQIASII